MDGAQSILITTIVRKRIVAVGLGVLGTGAGSYRMITCNWSANEFSVARALALQVRLITREQVARGWFEGDTSSEAQASDVLDRLEKSGLVERWIFEAHPLIPQVRPLLFWKAGKPFPGGKQFARIAELSRQRWQLPHVPVEVYRASRRACRAFGAFIDAQDARDFEATHDLHLSEVFVRYRRKRPAAAKLWLGEAAFPKFGLEIRGMKDPDAFLVDREGNGRQVIEFTGTYEEKHLRALHMHCAGGAAAKLGRQQRIGAVAVLRRLYPANGINYELW